MKKCWNDLELPLVCAHSLNGFTVTSVSMSAFARDKAQAEDQNNLPLTTDDSDIVTEELSGGTSTSALTNKIVVDITPDDADEIKSRHGRHCAPKRLTST